MFLDFEWSYPFRLRRAHVVLLVKTLLITATEFSEYSLAVP